VIVGSFLKDSAGRLKPSDVVLRTFQRHGISKTVLASILEGDRAAIEAACVRLLASRINTDKPRAWMAEAIFRSIGPCHYTTETTKRLWFGSHDYIAMLLGAEGLRSLAAFDQDLAALPETVTAWRAEWQRPSGFLTDARSWALNKNDALQYLTAGKVLITENIAKANIVLRIPPHKHMSGVDEIVALPPKLAALS
jgi:hypothetical protein